jgi:serine/threonine protein phosphatase 1
VLKNLVKLVKQFGKPPTFPSPLLPINQRVYCIGDIHGRSDLLKALHQIIRIDAANFTGQITLIYLGDYIDRGADSKGVVDYLLSAPLPDFKTVYLMGNHEQVLLEFLHSEDSPRTALWLNCGGLATLMSYGVEVTGIPLVAEIKQIRHTFRAKLPDSHLHFYQFLQSATELGAYYFVHAGILPGKKLSQQQLEDQLWIREKFLASNRQHEKIIVHGHSISETPERLPNRIGIDTGAYSTEKLTCVVLEADEQRFLCTGS